jgi:hypothetical protein
MTTAPAVVSFHDPEEYLAGLRLDKDRIDRGVLRVTVRRRYGALVVVPSVVAGAVIKRSVVNLEHPVGESFSGEEVNRDTAAKRKAVLDKLV